MQTEKPVVLIVDDVAINLRIAAEVLKEEYRIIIADNGEKAIRAAREKQPDLILLDIMMPEVSGFQVAKVLKNDPNTSEIPIIFFTAKTQPEDTVEAFRAGGVDYITKPFQRLELVQRIKTHIQLSHQKKELYQTSIELKQLNDEKNKLFSVVAHDLRNFVGGSKQLLEVTSERFEEYDKATIQERINIVIDNLQKTTVLMNELLTWSRKQNQRSAFYLEQFLLLPDVVKNIENYETMAKEKEISLSQSVKDGFKIFGDKNMLNTVLRNLIHNAIKYTPKGGTVHVTASESDGYTQVAVIDSGIGIPEENLDAIFSEEFKSTRGTTGETGTAVGLKLCKEYITKHQGMIRALNNENGGSRFEFTIPARAIES
jgi:two-component system, sensor histidine kinase and response regulator